MDGETTSCFAYGQAGIDGADFAEGLSRLLLKILGVCVIGSELLHEDTPCCELRRLLLLNDHEAAITKPGVQVEREGRTLQGSERPHIDGNGQSD